MRGNLLKMKASLNNPTDYYLTLDNKEIYMNELLNQRIEFRFLDQIHCIRCGRKTSKSFAQGYCFPCFRTAPETEECVLRPELCRAHEGIARDMQFAETYCLTDHFVYLSFTSGLKVGVTRHTQIPIRWIDQGATAAIKLAQTPNRNTAGLIETALKNQLADKTNWRKMLKDSEITVNLVREKQKAIPFIPDSLTRYVSPDDEICYITYPFVRAPEKIHGIGFDKTRIIQGILTGIKGQYLIFESGEVLNIRKHGGYLVELKIL